MPTKSISIRPDRRSCRLRVPRWGFLLTVLAASLLRPSGSSRSADYRSLGAAVVRLPRPPYGVQLCSAHRSEHLPLQASPALSRQVRRGERRPLLLLDLPDRGSRTMAPGHREQPGARQGSPSTPRPVRSNASAARPSAPRNGVARGGVRRRSDGIASGAPAPALAKMPRAS